MYDEEFLSVALRVCLDQGFEEGDLSWKGKRKGKRKKEKGREK